MNETLKIDTPVAAGDLVIFDKSYSPAALFVPGACDPLIDRIRAEVKKEVFDPSTEEGRKHIKSIAFKVTKSKTAIEAARVTLVSDEKKRLAAIDAEGKRIREALEALADEVRQPVTDFENREKDRIAKHETNLAELKALGELAGPAGVPPLTTDIRKRLDQIKAFDCSQFEEFQTVAAGVKAQLVENFAIRLAASEKADAERAELERLRAEAEERAHKDREAEIAAKAKAEAEEAARRREEEAAQRQAAELARVEREKQEAEDRAAQAERDRIAQAERAEQDRIAAEKLAEQQRIRAEADAKRREAEATERERARIANEKAAEEAETRRREADKAHRAKINREILAALCGPAASLSEGDAKAVITAIAKGEIPHTRISY